MTKTYTLIGACVGDLVSDEFDDVTVAELGQEAPDAGIITWADQARLMELPAVVEFFAANNYGPDNDVELMYLAEGEVTSGRYPTLTVSLPTGPTVVNLTPHDITVNGVTLSPTGVIPRVAEETREAGTVTVDGVEIPITEITLGSVVGLPEPVDGTLYVVSRMTAEAAPDRRDLLIPGKQIRDEQGRIVGCSTLSRLPAPTVPAASRSASPAERTVEVALTAPQLFRLGLAGLEQLRRLGGELRGRVGADETTWIAIRRMADALDHLAAQVAAQISLPDTYPRGGGEHQDDWTSLRGTCSQVVAEMPR